MKYNILDHYSQASEYSAKYIRNLHHPVYTSLWGSPLGAAPLGCYKKLIEYYKNEDLSFQYGRLSTWMSIWAFLETTERVTSFMWDTFLKHIDICPENTQILDGNAVGLQAECDAFEETIKALFVGGMGLDEHIAFYKSGSSLLSRTHVKMLAMDTILASARFFSGNLTKVPTMALTVGMGTDCHGVHKAFALHKAIEEGVNHMWTMFVFPQYPHMDATLELKVKIITYFRDLKLVHNKLKPYTD
uniref:Uncharacterized protein n=1 Tax=Capra hircus TaxID=9925 RepID=A0A452F7M3_CAPHI